MRTVALSPGGEEGRLPRSALERTFEKYLENLSRREAGEGDSYTPYEWRNVGALVRLGRRDEAHMVYQFPLPPLVLHAMLSGNVRHLRRWLRAMPPAPLGCAYFNFTASHDGIGMRPVKSSSV